MDTLQQTKLSQQEQPKYQDIRGVTLETSVAPQPLSAPPWAASCWNTQTVRIGWLFGATYWRFSMSNITQADIQQAAVAYGAAVCAVARARQLGLRPETSEVAADAETRSNLAFAALLSLVEAYAKQEAQRRNVALMLHAEGLEQKLVELRGELESVEEVRG